MYKIYQKYFLHHGDDEFDFKLIDDKLTLWKNGCLFETDFIIHDYLFIIDPHDTCLLFYTNCQNSGDYFLDLSDRLEILNYFFKHSVNLGEFDGGKKIINEEIKLIYPNIYLDEVIHKYTSIFRTHGYGIFTHINMNISKTTNQLLYRESKYYNFINLIMQKSNATNDEIYFKKNLSKVNNKLCDIKIEILED